MYGAAVFQVTHQENVQIFQCSLCLVDRVEIEHRLRRVLVGSVTCVDNGHRGYFAGIPCSSFEIVSHDDNICIVAHHHDRVFKCFPFGRAGSFGVRESDYSCTETVGSCFKTQAGTGRRFKEQGCYNLSL